MALDRQNIEKKDFPIGRRGYDPEAVDSHLATVADELDRLRSESRKRTETLASTASEQVRMIVEAAEQSAAEITRQAEADAKEIRTEADAEAQSTRAQANDQAREYVAKVNEASSGMLERVDAMQQELDQLVDGLRTGANRLNADLALLEGNMAELGDATNTARPAFSPEPDDELEVAAEILVEEPLEEEVIVEEEIIAVEAEGNGTEEAAAEAAEGGQSDDAEGARLVALNMALNGTPRDETDRYLAENYSLDDRAALLDEVYATVGE